MVSKMKVQTFFLEVSHVFYSFSGKLGEIWAKMVFEVCFDLKMRPT